MAVSGRASCQRGKREAGGDLVDPPWEVVAGEPRRARRRTSSLEGVALSGEARWQGESRDSRDEPLQETEATRGTSQAGW